jgi:hypothetical protein
MQQLLLLLVLLPVLFTPVPASAIGRCGNYCPWKHSCRAGGQGQIQGSCSGEGAGSLLGGRWRAKTPLSLLLRGRLLLLLLQEELLLPRDVDDSFWILDVGLIDRDFRMAF